MIAALGVQPLHGGDSVLQGLPLASIGDAVVIKGEIRVVAILNGYGNVTHQGVEGLGPLYEAHGKGQGRVLFILHLNGDLVLGEHVAGAEPELEGVSQIDGDGDAGSEAMLDCGLDRGLGSQDPGGPGEVHRHRVDADARDREAKPFQCVFGIKGRSVGSCDEVGDGLGDEGP